jgi:predicted dehydrogenase
MVSKLSRRDFLKTSSAAAVAAGIGLSIGPAEGREAMKKVSANDKIVIGVVGYGGRAQGVMGGFMGHQDCVVGAVCDVYDKHLEDGLAAAGPQAKGYKDFRKLLEQKDLDAVIVTTPPHWHPLISIMAMQAGKDVYCEKPISRFPGEAVAMAKVARDTKRVTQVGTQIHALDNFRRCVEIVQSGALGKVHCVRVVCTLNEYPGGVGQVKNSKAPAGLDWDTWCGPAPYRPFNQARFTAHRYFKDYVGSWMNELGPHIADLAFWAMNCGQPKSASAIGGRFVADDCGDIPDTVNVLWEFPDFNMTWMNTCGNSFDFGLGDGPAQANTGRALGVIFHGTNGTLMGNYGWHRVVSEADRLKDFKAPEPSIPSSPGHDREFLDCIKSRQLPSCNFEYHMPIAVSLNLGHIALNTGRKVKWDAKKAQIIGDKEANDMVMPEYRKPWAMPKI